MTQKSLPKSEIIIGKIANDTTNPVITAYLNGLYGSLEDENAAKWQYPCFTKQIKGSVLFSESTSY